MKTIGKMRVFHSNGSAVNRVPRINHQTRGAKENLQDNRFIM